MYSFSFNAYHILLAAFFDDHIIDKDNILDLLVSTIKLSVQESRKKMKSHLITSWSPEKDQKENNVPLE